MKLIRFASVVVALVLLVAGCSTADGRDMDLLRQVVSQLPRASLVALKANTMRLAGIAWLKKKKGNREVLKLMCRQQNPDGSWGDWYKEVAPDESGFDTAPTLVDYFLDLMTIDHKSYLDVKTNADEAAAYHAIRQSQKYGRIFQCQNEWTVGFAPEEVPQEIVNPDAVKVDDVVENILRLPAPPPEWVGLEGIDKLLPYFCPLAGDPNGWGCPSDPNSPPQQPVPGDK